MISYDDFKKIITDIKNDKIMVWALRVIIIFVAISIVIEVPWFFIDKYHGKHAKMIYGLFEANIPKDHPDTVYKSITKFKTDTVYRIGKKIFYNKATNVGKIEEK